MATALPRRGSPRAPWPSRTERGRQIRPGGYRRFELVDFFFVLLLLREALEDLLEDLPLLLLAVFFLGKLLRFVLAMSRSCFLFIELYMPFDAPLRDVFFFLPRFAARAAPAAICCFFDLAGMSSITLTNAFGATEW